MSSVPCLTRVAWWPRVLRATGMVCLLVVPGCAKDDEGTGPGRSIVITTARTLPAGSVGTEYDLTLTATGGSGTMTWRLESGSTPAGLSLSADGRLNGMPAVAGSQTFTVHASSSGLQPATAEFTLTIVQPPLLITTTALPEATLGLVYSRFLDVVGGEGPTSWSLASGALPPGILLSATGVLSGSATALGSASFRVRATRGALVAERTLSLTVNPPALTMTTAALPPAKVGRLYSAQLESSGGIGGNAWTITDGVLPTGLTLGTDGVISGTPVVAGLSVVTVAVSSGAQQATRTLSLIVDPEGYPSSVLITMPGNVFVPLLVELARGGTVTWRFGAEPHNAIFVAAPGAPADINIVSNVDVSRTFPSAGTFRYDCTIHPGMSGVIDVKP